MYMEENAGCGVPGVWADPSDAALFAWGVGSGFRLQSVSSGRRAHLCGGVGGTAGGAHPVFSGVSGSAAEGRPGFASRPKVGNCPPSYVRGAERLCRNPLSLSVCGTNPRYRWRSLSRPIPPRKKYTFPVVCTRTSGWLCEKSTLPIQNIRPIMRTTRAAFTRTRGCR